MRKFYLLLIVLLALTNSYSQEVYFLTGTNFTKYNFNSQGGAMSTPLQAGTGSFYEVGYDFSLNSDVLSFSGALTLNDYNALAGSPANSYSWQTKYAGAQTSLNYLHKVTKRFKFGLRAGVNLSKIVYGKQNLNGVVYDLLDQKEFSGLYFSYFGGASANYKLNDSGYLSFGYGYSNGLNTANSTQEKVIFNNQQIQFGIHFNINK
jgi:hypothetical protein